MFHIILFEPEIPPNTGNIMRLANNVGCRLSLVKPLGFELSDTRLRRAGLDYRDWVDVQLFEHLSEALAESDQERVFAFSTKGTTIFTEISYRAGDTLLFGPETRGLPQAVRDQFLPHVLRIPLRRGSRSLNLGNAVAIALYEAWRQTGFENSI